MVFVTSHQAHFIREVETMPEYEAVARSKRAGEEALQSRLVEACVAAESGTFARMLASMSAAVGQQLRTGPLAGA